jgi:predicted RNA binding protein with dsRBD fold (UPF0201 family)
MEQVSVYVETEINPTEDEEKVRCTVDNFFSTSEISFEPAQKGKTLIARAKGQGSLTKFRNLLRNDCIRDAARKMLFKSTSGNRIVFYLNKQVAFAGHISFCEATGESPLGPIKVIIETEQPQQLIEWLAEKKDLAGKKVG